jgi:outer membrane protein OmpA-like peptidoglycan-associated protein
MRRRALALLAFSALGAASADAAAQDGGFALNQLQPSPAGDVFIGVPSPYAAGHLAPSAYMMFDYAHRPIRLAGVADSLPVVGAQGFMRLDASLALWERLLVSVDVPVAVVLSGDDPGLAGTTFTALESPQFGDIRIGARARIWGEDGSAFQFGAGGYVFVPSGDPQHYAGEGAVRGGPHAVIGGRIGESIGFLYSAAFGAELRGSDSPQALTYGAGAALLFVDDMIQVGPELFGVISLGGDLPLSTTPVLAAPSGATAELMFTGKLRFLDGLTFGGGAGPGLGSTVGTPIFRAMGFLGWTPMPGPAPGSDGDAVAAVGDKDDDGINDAIDACPDVAGEPNPDPAKDGCPPGDKDQDGVQDIDDACPTTAGLRSADATKNGCPKDTDDDGYHDGIDACPQIVGDGSDDPKKVGCPADDDGDTIPNRQDGCPTAAGDPHDDPTKNGCPPDPDGDGIRYAADACPNEKGYADPDPQKNGCPRFVRVTKGQIEITQRIEFETYGDSLAESVTDGSAAVLTEVASAISTNKAIRSVEVQGHTDDSGDEGFNQELSQRRAETVRQWLIDKGGVPADKLSAKGYGYTRPVADNRLRLGRQANRRVEFAITSQDQKK